MKKLVSILLLAVFLVATLGGCAQSDTAANTTAAEEEAAPAAQEEAAPAAQEEAAPAAQEEAAPAAAEETEDEEVVIQVFHYMIQTTKQAGLDAVEAAYSALHPNVKFENIMYNQGTDYFPQLSTALASGELPEVIMGNPGLYPDVVAEGFAMDLTDNEVIASLNLPAGDLGDVSADGKIFGFPIDFKTWGAFYNVGIFNELGLEVPTTQAELIAVCEALEAAGIDPWIHSFADAVFGDIEMRNTVWPRALAAGDNDLFESLMSGDSKLADYPYMLEGLQVWQQRMQWHRPDALANNQDKSLELFVAGEGAMLYTGSWGVGDLVSKIPDGSDFEFNFFIAPIDDDPDSQKLNVQVDQSFMVNPKSEYAEQALDFMEFWITDGSTVWSETTLLPLTTGATSEELLPLVKTLAEIKASGNIAHYGDFTRPYNTEFTTAWRKALNEFAESTMTDGGMTPEECLENMQAYFDDIIATNK